MSALFISHSSADNAWADELKAALAAAGHRSFFLDFDPEAGIAAGRHWEQELYAQLRACQAVIVICSVHSMTSAWCLAEITHARALGKPILPLKVDDCKVWSLLDELQVVDFVTDREAGLQRIVRGLKSLGLDPKNLFDWDGSRPPYPGLLAFQRADAAVYFGREPAIQKTLETLERLRRLGGPRLLIVLGASGSGKSSLVRAGVLPRLERDASVWVVTSPFRPLARPLESMALVLADALGEGNCAGVEEALAGGDARAWRDIVNRLRSRAGPEASVLIAVDQFEEALDGAPGADDERAAFLRLLRSIADDASGPVFVIATLRSDFLGALQTHPVLRGVVYEPVHLAQIERADIAAVIDGPARVAALRLESGLTQAMVADTTADDALPLLAFTLRELYDRFGSSGELTIEHYRDRLGGLQGSLARAAEALCDVGDAELEALRRAFLELVRIDADGRYVRQLRRWSELPLAAHALLERFVRARLLVASSGGDGERVLDVAHEALFRSWGRLAAWLAADREFLLWRGRLDAACQTWRDNARDDNLVLRGPLLAEAQRWLADRGDALTPQQREFIEAGIAARDAAQAARERARRRFNIVLGGAALVLGVAFAIAAWQWRVATQERHLAVARELAVQGDVAYRSGDLVGGLLLTLHSLQSAWTPDAHDALIRRLDSIAAPQPSKWKPHPGPIRAIAISPDRRWLATAGQGHLQVQSSAGEVRDLGSANHHDYLHALAFSADGHWLAAACEVRVICIFDTTQWQVAKRLSLSGSAISALAFGAGDHLLASISRGLKGVHLFEMPEGKEVAPLDTGEDAPDGMAISRDGRRLAVSTRKGIEFWDPAERTHLTGRFWPGAQALAFSKDGFVLAAAGGLMPAVFTLDDAPTEVAEQWGKFYTKFFDSASGGRPFGAVSFSEDLKYVALSDSGQGVRIASPASGSTTITGPGRAGALVFGGGRRLIAGELDGRITEWDPDDKPLRRIPHSGKLLATALSRDARRLATASEGGSVRLIDTDNGNEIGSARLPCDTGGLAFSVDARFVAAVSGNDLRLWEPASGRVFGPFEHQDQVVGVRFDEGGQRIATATLWEGDARYGVRRPTRLRVLEITSGRELGWRFDLEGDRKRTKSFTANKSLDNVLQPTEGGDASLVAAAAAWPVAYATDDLNFYPRLLIPDPPWLSTKTTTGVALVDAALDRAKAADSVDGESEHPFSISADGRLLSSAAGNEARLWPLRFAELEAQACQRLGRNLTCSEWHAAQGDAPYRKACPQQPDPDDLATCKGGIAR